MKTRQQIIEEAILNELMTATARYAAKSPIQAAVSAVKGFVTGQGAREGVRQAALADYRGDAETSQQTADDNVNAWIARGPGGRRGSDWVEGQAHTGVKRALGIQRAENRLAGIQTPPTR